ncbi:hypothetical protein [Rhodomicrobium vannielii]|nr:hypothetical protein [Rhodomicrobium vannielii]
MSRFAAFLDQVDGPSFWAGVALTAAIWLALYLAAPRNDQL